MAQHATSPAPFFATVLGGDASTPLRVVVTHLIERHGLEALVAATREEALARAKDPACVLVVDLAEQPLPIAEALEGRPVPVLAGDPATLLARLRPTLDLARDAASALARMRAVSNGGQTKTTPSAADLGLRPAGPRSEELARTIASLAADGRPVLIQGPPGSGKKHVARLIHTLSARRGGPIVVADAAQVTPETAAPAHGGTLVLEGAERLAPAFGAALGTLVGERRIGDRVVDARVILLAREDPLGPFAAATPKSALEGAHVLRLPALADNPGDVIALTDELLAAEAARRGQALELSFAALEHVLAYPWPGGVRELQAACEHAARAADGLRTVEPEHLPAPVQRALRRTTRTGPTLASVVDAVERTLIARSIQQHRGRLDEVSRSLGVAPRTLRRKILQHGLREETAALRRSA